MARRYLLDRGISEESIQTFRLGYAPDGWDNIGAHLRASGYAESDIEPTGLLVNKQPATSNQQQAGVNPEEPDATRYTLHATHSYDRFRNRILFPLGIYWGE